MKTNELLDKLFSPDFDVDNLQSKICYDAASDCGGSGPCSGYCPCSGPCSGDCPCDDSSDPGACVSPNQGCGCLVFLPLLLTSISSALTILIFLLYFN